MNVLDIAKKISSILKSKLGTTDISNIGDGTVTGAISNFSSTLSTLGTVTSASGTYTTAKWSPGTCTVTLTLPEAGCYVLLAGFAISSDTADNCSIYAQYHLQKTGQCTLSIGPSGTCGYYDGAVASGYGVRAIRQVVGFATDAAAGDVITPYIHTGTVGVVHNVTIYAMKIS